MTLGSIAVCHTIWSTALIKNCLETGKYVPNCALVAIRKRIGEDTFVFFRKRKVTWRKSTRIALLYLWFSWYNKKFCNSLHLYLSTCSFPRKIQGIFPHYQCIIETNIILENIRCVLACTRGPARTREQGGETKEEQARPKSESTLGNEAASGGGGGGTKEKEKEGRQAWGRARGCCCCCCCMQCCAGAKLSLPAERAISWQVSHS